MDNRHLHDLVESCMGTWETLHDGKESGSTGWETAPKPPKRLRRVSMAIVLGGRESRPQGEGPQPVGVSARYSRMRTRRHLCGCRRNAKETEALGRTGEEHRFYDLYHLLYHEAWLSKAQVHVKRNAGSKTAGCDGVTMRDFEEYSRAISGNSKKPSRQKGLNHTRCDEHTSRN